MTEEELAAQREARRAERALEADRAARRQTRALGPVPQPLPAAVQPVPTLGDVSLEAQAEARKAAEEAADPFKSVLPPDAFQRRVESDSALIEAELERRRAGTPLAGGGVQAQTDSRIPFLRPTRIRDGMYTAPGEAPRAPTATEVFVESLAQQPVADERSLLRKSVEDSYAQGGISKAERDARIKAIEAMQTQDVGPGVTEGPLSALFGGTLAAFPAAAYEFGASAVEAALPLAPASVRDYVDEVGVIAPIIPGMPAIPIPRATSEKSALERTGARLSARGGFAESFGRNPKLIGYYQRELGLTQDQAQTFAQTQGQVLDLFAPSGPGTLVRGAKVAAGLPGVERAVAAVGRGASGAAAKVLPERVFAVVGSGATADRALARQIVPQVIEQAAPAAAKDDAVKAALQAVDTASEAELAEPRLLAQRITRAVTAPDVDYDALNQGLLRRLPAAEPLVQVAGGVAVPRSVASRVRSEVAKTLRGLTDAEIVQRARSSLNLPPDVDLPLRTAREYVRSAESLRVGGFAARELRTVVRAQQDAAEAGNWLERAFPAVAESSIIRRSALLRGDQPSAETVRTERLIVQAARRLQRKVMSEVEQAQRNGRPLAEALDRLTDGSQLEGPLTSKLYGERASLESVKDSFRGAKTMSDYRRAADQAARTGLVRPVPQATLERGVIAALLDEGGRRAAAQYGIDLARATSGVSILQAPVIQPIDDMSFVGSVAAKSDQVLREGAQELARYADGLSVPQQTALVPLVVSALAPAAERQIRLYRQAARYGVVIPRYAVAANLGRMLVMPWLSVGPGVTARAARAVLRRALGGGPLQTPSGPIAPEDVARMADDYGVGMTAVEVERIGTLADSLLVRARASKIRNAASVGRDIWVLTAEAIERTVRLGVFEAGLARGLDPAAAAREARRSVIDYEELLAAQPGLVEWALRLAPGAAEQAALTAELFSQLARDPSRYRLILRASEQAMRAVDPEQQTGDEGLRRLGLVRTSRIAHPGLLGAPALAQQQTGLTVYGPYNPVFAPISTAVGTLATARDTVWVAERLAAALRTGTVGLPADARETVRQAGMQVAAALTQAEQLSSSPVQRRRQMEAVYAALVMTAALEANGDPLDPDTTGAAAGVLGLLDPIPARPDTPGATPFVGRGPDGRPVWLGFAPSEQGIANLELLLAVPGAELATAFPLFAQFGLTGLFDVGPGGDVQAERVEGLRAARSR